MPVDIPLELLNLEEIADTYGTPYYIYDKNLIKKFAIKYMNTFTKYFPTFKQYFAVKALPNPSILQILKECGMGFDCSSPEEIKIVRLMDYNMSNRTQSDIIYTSNYTSIDDLSWVLSEEKNIIINLDDIDGLTNMLLSKQNKPDTICFRYNLETSAKSDKSDLIKSNIFSGSDTKFGMTYEFLENAYKAAKLYNIKKFGIHVMTQSNCIDIEFWKSLIDDIFDIIYKLKMNLGVKIEFVDIGGGIGIPYRPEQKEINLEELVLLIRERFDYKINKYSMDYEPQLLTECGRYITGPYGWLVSRCKSIKTTSQELFYGLDANMAHLMRPGMYDAYHHITIPRLLSKKEKKKANVVGTLCENNDWFCKQRELPTNIKKGDLFVIHDCGAHSYSMGFNYNSKLHCPELLITNNKIKQIRYREDINYHLQNTLIYYDVRKNMMYKKILSIIILIIFILLLALLLVFIYFSNNLYS